MASGCLGLISFPREPGRVTLERLDERYPQRASDPARAPRDRLRARALRAARRARARARAARTTWTRARVEGEDPLAPFGPNAARHVKRTDGFPHCADLMVNSTYWHDLDEVAAFEELVGSHGGLGGTQSYPFLLHPVGARSCPTARWSAPRPCTASCAAGSCSSATRSTRRSSVPAMTPWPAVDYETWSATCDTLHAHTQVLGKLAATLAPPEPQLQHAALRLTARGWETLPLPAPDGSGAFVVALDLRAHEAVVEHSGGRTARVALTPHRPVGAVTRDVLAAVRDLGGPVRDRPDAAGGAVEGAARRGRGARHLRPGAGRRLLRRGDPGGAGAGRVPGALPRAARRRSTPGGGPSTWR